jgi:hypothetical protein
LVILLLVCKPQTHKTLFDWASSLPATHHVKTVVVTRRHGKKVEIDTYRFVNQVPLRDGDDAKEVNWCELITTDKSGRLIYKNSFVTNHLITEENVTDMVKSGRARWKIENNNILKTKGYNFEHNFGHGKKHLSSLLMTLNVLAFLFHTLLGMMDSKYQLVRSKLPTRKTFFDDIRALTRYICFDSWNALLNFMIRGLELDWYGEPERLDTS